MELQKVDVFDDLSPADFKANYYRKKPIVIRNLSENWPARSKWNWDYLKSVVGNRTVAVYSNRKNAEHEPVNTAHNHMLFHDYVEKLQSGEGNWRLFLFDILKKCPQLLADFDWPVEYFGKMLTRYPMLFTGFAGSVTHLHYDMDLSDVIQTQFLGRKRVLLFPFEEQFKIYRRPFEVMSLVDFTGYYRDEFQVVLDTFPALKLAKGYDVILEHGDTLYMPSKFWHHMEYLEPGIGLSLRSWQTGLSGKADGLYHLFFLRHLDGLLKRSIPKTWYDYKLKQIRLQEKKLLSSGV